MKTKSEDGEKDVVHEKGVLKIINLLKVKVLDEKIFHSFVSPAKLCTISLI